MLDDSGRDNIEQGSCDCYKRLEELGIPLYISEENDEYAEHKEINLPEDAFPLPKFVSINQNITDYPVVEDNELSVVFLQMTEVVPELSDFEVNVLSFWMLDMFIEGLQTAQEAGMSHQHQWATLEWIAYLFNYIQKNVVTRSELSKHIKTTLFKYEDDATESLGGTSQAGDEWMRDVDSISDDNDEAESKLSFEKEGRGKIWTLPLPPGVSERKEAEIDPDSDSNASTAADSEQTAKISTAHSNTGSNSSDKEISERNVSDMKIILEIIYRIFGRLWVFHEIQTTFHTMPSVKTVDLPFTLNVPKPRFKQEVTSLTKIEKSGKKSVAPTKSPEELESERQSHKNDYILPLQASEEAKSYTKMFVGLSSDRSVSIKGGKGGKK